MPQFRDASGNIWEAEVDAQGNPIPGTERHVPQNAPPADPGFQYEGQIAGNKAAASDYDPALAAADLKVKTSRAKAAERTAETGASAESRASTKFAQEQQGEANTLALLQQGIDNLDKLYKESFEGKGLQSIAETYTPFGFRPANEQLNTAANSLSSTVARALQLTGQQFNTPAEAAMFIGGMLPKNDDTDEVLVDKMVRLKNVYENAAQNVSVGTGKEYKPRYDRTTGAKISSVKPPAEPPQGQADLGASDATQQRMIDAGTGGRQAPAAGGSRTVDNPALAGVNEEVYNMLTSGKSAAEIGGYLESKGVNPIPMMGSIQENVELQKTNPGIRPYINIDDMQEDIPVSKQISGALLNNPVGAAGAGMINATTMGYADEIATKMGAENAQQTQEYLRQQYPGSSFAGELGGAIVGMKGAGGALKATGRPATAKTALAGDVGYGAAYGSGEAPDNRALGALVGAGSAGAGNLIGGRVVAPLLEKPVNLAANKARGMFGAGPKALAAKPAKTESMVLGRIGDDTTAQLQEAQNLGLPMALADTSPQLRTLAGSAVRKSPAAREFAESTIQPRAMGQAERATQAVDDYLQPVGDITAQQAALIKKARAESDPLYKQAYAAPGAEDAFAQLQPLLQRPSVADAMKAGQRIAADEGVPLGSGPSWQSLDYTKRGLDDVIQGQNNPMTGGTTSQGRAAQGARAELLGVTDELNPAFKAARAAYGGPVSIKGAIDQGRKAGNMKPDVLGAQFAGMPPTGQEGFKLGFAGGMSDKINSAQMTGNPYSRVYGSPNQQANVGQLFPEGAQDFGRIAQLENQMGKTAYETLGGSPTAARSASDALFDEGAGAGNIAEVGLSAATGVPPVNAMLQGARKFGADGIRLGLGKKAEQRAADIAPMLLETNPAAALSFMDEALARKAAFEAQRQKSRRIGGMFGSGLGVAGSGQFQ